MNNSKTLDEVIEALKDVEGMSVFEIAGVTGKSLMSVRYCTNKLCSSGRVSRYKKNDGIHEKSIYFYKLVPDYVEPENPKSKPEGSKFTIRQIRNIEVYASVSGLDAQEITRCLSKRRMGKRIYLEDRA